MTHIYVIEDDAAIGQALMALLEANGYDATHASSVEQASEDDKLVSADLILADLKLPGAPGTEVVTLAPQTPVLIMTAYASVRSAVDSMQRGAVDYIAKPFGYDELLTVIKRTLDRADKNDTGAGAATGDEPDDKSEGRASTYGLIGECASMRQVYDRIARAAPTDATVLILGESGTGKELVARALHDASPRRRAPMVAVNCAAIPLDLVESELFGHEKGAFTGASQAREGLVGAANGGTLFLDEIGELPLDAQARLLRVVQEGEVRKVGSTRSLRVDVRLIAATHRDLPALVREGRFRQDLYFRLNVMAINLPPLRERAEDIPALAHSMLERSCTRLRRPVMQLAPAAMAAIRSHAWPGNVRELENALERAVILSDGDTIGPELLHLGEHPLEDTLDDDPESGISPNDYFCRFVTAHQDELTETELAQRLGISRKTLWERRKKLGVARPAAH